MSYIKAKNYFSKSFGKCQRGMKWKNLVVVIAVSDASKGVTTAFKLQKDRSSKNGSDVKTCEYLFHKREPVSNEEEKVILQQKNLYSALEFWQDALKLPENVFVMSDLDVEHFSADIRIILHQLKLEREKRSIKKDIQLVMYGNAVTRPAQNPAPDLPIHENIPNNRMQIQESESYDLLVQTCQLAAKALSEGNIGSFKELLIVHPINVQKFTSIPIPQS